MATIQDLMTQGIQRLAGWETARLDVSVLLEHVLGVGRATLYAYPERQVSDEHEQLFSSLLERRIRGEPVAYLVGQKEFYGLDFVVDGRVLIPRPETELLVDAALDAIRKRLDRSQNPIVADIGTGSGAIPVTLAVEEPRVSTLYATDISADALVVARLNCERHSVEQRVHLLHGDLLTPLPEPVDVLTANLPYIGTNEMAGLAPDILNYEPHLALFSGPYGLDLIERFFTQAHQSAKLNVGSVLLLEIGYAQRKPLIKILNYYWPDAVVTFKKDYLGWDRLVSFQSPQ